MEGYRIIPSRKLSELEQFAIQFHQDWNLIFSDVHEGARLYIGGLPTDRKAALGRELSRFLETHAGESIEKSWNKLGVQRWPKNLDTRTVLKQFLEMTTQHLPPSGYTFVMDPTKDT